MTVKYKLELEEAGCDTKATLERFMGNEALYEKFLCKFAADTTLFEQISEAVEKQDRQTVFMHAHTLKGVTGNLGLTPLYQRLSEVVERLRGEANLSEVEATLEEIKNLHTELCTIIRQNS